MKVCYTFIFIFGLQLNSLAQDYHLSQPNSQAPSISPAFTAQNNSLAIQGTYRQQWRTAGVPFQTQIIGFQARPLAARRQEGFLGVGLMVARDIATQNIGTNTAQLHLAYHLPFERNHLFSAGLQFGFAQRNFEPAGQWGGQYDGLAFDANILPSITLQNRYSASYLDAGLGFAYAYQRGTAREKTLSHFHIGIGAQHLNQPRMQLLDANARLRPRLALLLQAEWCLGSVRTALEPLVLYQLQQPAQEFLYGLAFKHYLNGGPFSRTANVQTVGFGLYNRWQDAVVVQFKMQLKQVQLACAYDVTVSSFSKAPQLQSAFELQLGYLFD